MTISYAILTHNQETSLQQLIINLLTNIDIEDEIIIVDDYSTTQYTKTILEKYSNEYQNVHVYKHKLNKNFSIQKNYLFDKCTKDYIFNLDADQNITIDLIKNIKNVLQHNNQIQLF